MKIVILCAGRGSRLGDMTDFIPKSMITINRKPVISFILDHIYSGCSFKCKVEVGVAVGYRAEILQNYIEGFYPDKDIKCIKVDKYQGSGAGPGYSLLQMKEFVAGEPFILILGDTLCFDDLATIVQEENVVGVYGVDNPARFTTCEIDNDYHIQKFYDKEENAPSNLAIIGVYYIKESELYFEGLEKTKELLIQNELQISNGLNYLLEKGKQIRALVCDWYDAGIEETLQSTRFCLGDHDTVFKNNTLTIIQDEKVRKFGFDESFDELIKYYKEIQNLPAREIYDEILCVSEEHPKYFDFKYNKNQKLAAIFLNKQIGIEKAYNMTRNVIVKLKECMYKPEKNIANSEDVLYEYKTSILESLKADSMMKEYIEQERVIINGIEQENPVRLLKSIDTGCLVPDFYVPIHGKLYLGNILYNVDTEDFKLIYPDMRFGKTFIYGDYACDLAMLKQCFNGKYNMIKADKFDLKINSANSFEYKLFNNELLEEINNRFESLVREVFGDDTLINKINLLEGILFLKNISQVSKKEQKIGFLLAATVIINKYV